MTNPTPTLAGFTAWVGQVMGVPSAWMPDPTTIQWAYDLAVSIVLPNIQCVPGPLYLVMVYNLAAHLLVGLAQDTTTSPPYPYKTLEDGTSYGFWGYLRKQNNYNGYVTGTVNNSSDEGTSVGLTVPRQAENLTLAQMQCTTTPWGRTYLGYAQSYGSNWGIS